MNRRTFIQRLAMLFGVGLVAPKVLAEKPDAPEKELLYSTHISFPEIHSSEWDPEKKLAKRFNDSFLERRA